MRERVGLRWAEEEVEVGHAPVVVVVVDLARAALPKSSRAGGVPEARFEVQRVYLRSAHSVAGSQPVSASVVLEGSVVESHLC